MLHSPLWNSKRCNTVTRPGYRRLLFKLTKLEMLRGRNICLCDQSLITTQISAISFLIAKPGWNSSISTSIKLSWMHSRNWCQELTRLIFSDLVTSMSTEGCILIAKCWQHKAMINYLTPAMIWFLRWIWEMEHFTQPGSWLQLQELSHFKNLSICWFTMFITRCTEEIVSTQQDLELCITLYRLTFQKTQTADLKLMLFSWRNLTSQASIWNGLKKTLGFWLTSIIQTIIMKMGTGLKIITIIIIRELYTSPDFILLDLVEKFGWTADSRA